jgi:hypothetical protein
MIRGRWIPLVAVFLAACGSEVVPAATPAPLAACLTFAVSDEQAMPTSYERDVQKEVRTSFETAMVEAGFNVLGDPSLPHDLTARLSIVPGSRVETGARVHAFLSLESEGKAVDQIEVSAPQEAPGYGGAIADQLVDAVFRSAKLAAFTRDLRKADAKHHLAAGALRLAIASAAAAPPAPPPPAATAAPAAPPPPPEPAPAGFLAGAPQPKAYAFVVGIEEYKNAPPVAGGKADAERFAELARRTLGIDESHMKVITGEKADKLAFDLTLEWLKLSVPPGGRVYFFFSGYGGLKRTTMTEFLLPQDGDPKAIDKTGIPLAAFLQALAHTRASEAIAVIDAGFSGAGGRSVLPPDNRPPAAISDPDMPAHAAMLTAVTSAEVAGTFRDGGGGLFSHYLLDGLGRGQADLDGDGQITLQELASWASPRVARDARRDKRGQTPAVLLGRGTAKPAEIVLATGLTVP